MISTKSRDLLRLAQVREKASLSRLKESQEAMNKEKQKLEEYQDDLEKKKLTGKQYLNDFLSEKTDLNYNDTQRITKLRGFISELDEMVVHMSNQVEIQMDVAQQASQKFEEDQKAYAEAKKRLEKITIFSEKIELKDRTQKEILLVARDTI
ncbi:MAG: hypothetical protein AAF228_07970 [Pseudomonadota bacterium]